METKSETLIADLVSRTHDILNAAQHYKSMSEKLLNWRPGSEQWSVLECLEHLNLYGDYYLPAVARKMGEMKYPASADFKAGPLGNYFAKSMLPREQLNKMKTFKDKNPIGSQLDKKTIDRFIVQQQQWLDLLNKSRNSNLNKIRIPITISKLIRLKLGDVLRFNTFHNQRHIAQADRVLKEAQHHYSVS